MRKLLILIIIMMSSYIYGNSYEILEKNGELFFKYSKQELLNDINSFLDENKEMLDMKFELTGNKTYREGMKNGKKYINKTMYDICNIENKLKKCIFYMDEKKKVYTEKNILEGNLIVMLNYDKSGKKPVYFSNSEGIDVWFKNGKIKDYRRLIKNKDNKIVGSITYIFDKKSKLEKIKISNPLLIKGTLYGEEVKGYSSSIGSENYYFDSNGKFIKKEMYYKYRPNKK